MPERTGNTAGRVPGCYSSPALTLLMNACATLSLLQAVGLEESHSSDHKSQLTRLGPLVRDVRIGVKGNGYNGLVTSRIGERTRG